jgi:hypothetical protein
MSGSLSPETRATMIAALVEDMIRLAVALPPPFPNPSDSRVEQLEVWVGDLAEAVGMLYDAAEAAVDRERVMPPLPLGRSS